MSRIEFYKKTLKGNKKLICEFLTIKNFVSYLSREIHFQCIIIHERM